MTTATDTMTEADAPTFMTDAEIDALFFWGKGDNDPDVPAAPTIQAICDWKPRDGKPVVIVGQWYELFRLVRVAINRGDKFAMVNFEGPMKAAGVRRKLERALGKLEAGTP